MIIKELIRVVTPFRVASMDFTLCVFMIELLKTVVCINFWTTSYFFGYYGLCEYLHIFEYDLNYFLHLNIQILKVFKGVTRWHVFK